jgi:hypothetical protein
LVAVGCPANSQNRSSAGDLLILLAVGRSWRENSQQPERERGGKEREHGNREKTTNNLSTSLSMTGF